MSEQYAKYSDYLEELDRRVAAERERNELRSKLDAERQRTKDLMAELTFAQSPEVCNCPHENVETCGYCQRDRLQIKLGSYHDQLGNVVADKKRLEIRLSKLQKQLNDWERAVAAGTPLGVLAGIAELRHTLDGTVESMVAPTPMGETEPRCNIWLGLGPYRQTCGKRAGHDGPHEPDNRAKASAVEIPGTGASAASGARCAGSLSQRAPDAAPDEEGQWRDDALRRKRLQDAETLLRQLRVPLDCGIGVESRSALHDGVVTFLDAPEEERGPIELECDAESCEYPHCGCELPTVSEGRCPDCRELFEDVKACGCGRPEIGNTAADLSERGAKE